MRALASAEKRIYIILRMYPYKPVSSMALVIHKMNVRSWVPLVLSIINAGVLSTVGIIPRLERNVTDSKRTIILLIMQWMIYS